MVGHLQDTSREDSQRLNFRKLEQNFLYDRLENLLNHLLVAVNPCRENLAEDGMEADRLVRTYEKVRRAYYNVVKLNGGGPHGPNVLIQKMKEKLNPEIPLGPPNGSNFNGWKKKPFVSCSSASKFISIRPRTRKAIIMKKVVRWASA